MAVSAKLFGKCILSAYSGLINLTSDDIKIVLLTSSFTPNQDTMQYYADLTNELTTANGYTAGGLALGTEALTYDAATNKTLFDSAAAEWTITDPITARYAVLYDNTPETNKPLLGWIDFGEDRTSENGYFRVTPAADGWLELAAA